MEKKNKKDIVDLEKQVQWYQDTFENRRLIGIIKDRLLKYFSAKNENQNAMMKRIEEEFIADEVSAPAMPDQPEMIFHYPKNKHERYLSYSTFSSYFYKKGEKTSPCSTKEKVYIILPVYNGLEYIKILIPQVLERTDLPYELIVINDCSPDSAVKTYLDKLPAHPCLKIIHNEKNLGFTATVNKGMRLSDSHVVFLNSDTEVPHGWLSRLMYPIFTDPKIGTVTPFSNCATICSFPNWDDNPIFDQMNVDELDAFFKNNIKPKTLEIPTGVGFCMAINKLAIQKIGMLDEEKFPKGYGEEIDMCRRAIAAGFKNTLLPNLFVYHKHGGSFTSAQKKELGERHQKKIETMYPDFMPEARKFILFSEAEGLRQMQSVLILNKRAQKTHVYFDHELGGGANMYTDNYIRQHKNNHLILVVTFIHPHQNPHKRFAARYFYKDFHGAIHFNSQEELFDFQTRMKIDECIVGSLITYEYLQAFLNFTHQMAIYQKSPLKYLVHDFHSVCVNFNLMYKNEKFCNVPDMKHCHECLQNVHIDPVLISKDYALLSDYRTIWLDYLVNKTSEVICFSESAKKIILKAYPLIPEQKIKIIPHWIPPLKPVNIGIIGNIHSKFKGGEILIKMADLLQKDNPNNIRLVVIGELGHGFKHQGIKELGGYHRLDLLDILNKNNIQAILIPSICSETFSYTTAEAIQSGLPVFSFDLGGQGDQVKQYKNGTILGSMEPEQILSALNQWICPEVKPVLTKEKTKERI